MKKIPTILVILVLVIFGQDCFGQAPPTPLYAGRKYGSQLYTIDTTGGGFSVTGSISMTSAYGPVYNVHGLALHPVSEELYVLYQSFEGSYNRRLGTVDPLTGVITDIGGTGYKHSDIEFGPDGRLYATSSSWMDGYQLREINPVTGTSSFLMNYAYSSSESGIMYNPFADELIKFSASSLSSINVGGPVPSEMTEGYSGSHPYRASACVVYSPTKAIVANNSTIYSFNPVTNNFAYMASTSGIWFHAFAFGKQPCEPIEITASSTELCEGLPVTLEATGVGTITWDGGITDGVPFTPDAPGVYHYTPTSDTDEDCPSDGIDITVIGLPTVIAGAGDLIFCEDESITLSTGGDADLYVWEDGDPLNLTPGIGTYTYSLTGYYTEGGCLGENYDEVTVEVVTLPTITASVSQSPICINNEVTFNGGGGTEYDWDNGVVDGENYTPGSTGIVTYTVYGTDENGCSNSASVDLDVVDLVSLSGVVTEEMAGADGAIDITVTGGAPAYTFDWDNDGTGDFDDTEDLTGLASGFYTVLVQSEAGCGASLLFHVDSQLSIDELGNTGMNVYPNPTQDNVNIELAGPFSYEILSINGEIILSGYANEKATVSLKELADGVYFVNVKSADNTMTMKVVKK